MVKLGSRASRNARELSNTRRLTQWRLVRAVEPLEGRMLLAGDFGFALALGGSNTSTSEDMGYAVAADADGNVYVAGAFADSGNFGGVTRTSVGREDIFVGKYSSTGALSWVRSFGSSGADGAYDIALDSAGAVYITGEFSNTVNFGTATLTSAGSTDAFVLKLDNAGNAQWVRKVGGFLGETGHGIAVDNSDNVIVTGIFAGTLDFDPGSGFMNATSQDLDDSFVWKLDSNGAAQWVVSLPTGSLGLEPKRGIATDSSGNVYLTSEFGGTGSYDFDPGPGVANLTSAGADDIVVVKLTSAGTLAWARAVWRNQLRPRDGHRCRSNRRCAGHGLVQRHREFRTRRVHAHERRG